MTPERSRRLILIAFRQLDKPYSVHYGSSEWRQDKGLKDKAKTLWEFDPNPKKFDCSGLVAWLYGVALGIRFPHGSKAQQSVCRKINFKKEGLDCGDLGFIERVNGRRHVLLHLHDGFCIEANGVKKKVIISEPGAMKKDPDFLGWFKVDGRKLSQWRKGIL